MDAPTSNACNCVLPNRIPHSVAEICQPSAPECAFPGKQLDGMCQSRASSLLRRIRKSAFRPHAVPNLGLPSFPLSPSSLPSFFPV